MSEEKQMSINIYAVCVAAIVGLAQLSYWIITIVRDNRRQEVEDGKKQTVT